MHHPGSEACIPLLGPKEEVLRAKDYRGYSAVKFEAGVDEKQHNQKLSGF